MLPVPAQAPPAPKTAPKAAAEPSEQKIAREAAQLLIVFAKTAEGQRAHDDARRAYREVITHYEPDNATARAALGWKKVKAEWQQATPESALPKDACPPAQRKPITTAWMAAQSKIVIMHRDLGVSLLAAEQRDRGLAQLQRVLALAPDDAAAHAALGHKKFEDFYGTPEQIAFIQRMRQLLDTADTIRAKEIAAEPVAVENLPVALQRTGFVFAGAKTEHITFWVAGSQEEANECAVANQRAVLLWQALFADHPERDRLLVLRPSQWVGVIRSPEQRQKLLEVSPECRDGLDMSLATLLDGTPFVVEGGRAEWARHSQDNDRDYSVAHFTKFATTALNGALTEGMAHMTTWLLCDTMLSSFIQLAKTTGEPEVLPSDPDAWFDRLRADIEARKDPPLVHVPRERPDNYRLATRFKAWSFMTWLIARHPDKWVQLLVALKVPSTPGVQPLMEEDVIKAFQTVLGRSVTEVDAEWREWARAGSTIGKVSGLPQ